LFAPAGSLQAEYVGWLTTHNPTGGKFRLRFALARETWRLSRRRIDAPSRLVVKRQGFRSAGLTGSRLGWSNMRGGRRRWCVVQEQEEAGDDGMEGKAEDVRP